MTIVFGVTCPKVPRFAVLAADELAVTRNADGTDQPLAVPYVKIRLHPHLPLALACIGPALLPVVSKYRDSVETEQGLATADHLELVLGDIKGRQKLRSGTLAERIRQHFLEPVRRLREIRELMGMPMTEADALRVVYTFVHQGRPVLGAVNIGERVRLQNASEDYATYINAPFCLEPLYTHSPQYPTRQSLYGFIPDIDEQAQYLYDVIATGIAREAELSSDGRNHECGLGIDVALIDENGARWWPKSSWLTWHGPDKPTFTPPSTGQGTQ